MLTIKETILGNNDPIEIRINTECPHCHSVDESVTYEEPAYDLEHGKIIACCSKCQRNIEDMLEQMKSFKLDKDDMDNLPHLHIESRFLDATVEDAVNGFNNMMTSIETYLRVDIGSQIKEKTKIYQDCHTQVKSLANIIIGVIDGKIKGAALAKVREEMVKTIKEIEKDESV